MGHENFALQSFENIIGDFLEMGCVQNHFRGDARKSSDVIGDVSPRIDQRVK